MNAPWKFLSITRELREDWGMPINPEQCNCVFYIPELSHISKYRTHASIPLHSFPPSPFQDFPHPIFIFPLSHSSWFFFTSFIDFLHPIPSFPPFPSSLSYSPYRIPSFLPILFLVSHYPHPIPNFPLLPIPSISPFHSQFSSILCTIISHPIFNFSPVLLIINAPIHY